MSRHIGLLLAIVVVVGVSGCGSGHGPSAPAVVARTRDGVHLAVADRGRQLCMRVVRSDPAQCVRPSRAVQFPTLQGGGSTVFGAYAWWGFVAREVKHVEIVFRDGERRTAATTPGKAYRGRYAGQGRFFLLASRGRRTPADRAGRHLLDAAYIRLLGSHDRVLAVQGQATDPRIGPAVRIAGSGTSAIKATVRRGPAPVAGDEERFADELCVGTPSDAEACVSPDARSAVVQPTIDCDRGTSLVGWLAPGDTLTVFLGNGARRLLRGRRLPSRFAHRRAFATRLGTGVAVRAVERRNARGRVVRRATLGLPPATVPCTGDLASAVGSDPVILDGRPHGRPRAGLAIQTRGAGLCVSLAGQTPARDAACPPPPASGAELVTIPGRYAGGVVPAAATRVLVAADRGPTQTVPTRPAGPQAGRWAAKVRVFSAPLPAGAYLDHVRTIDAQSRASDELPAPVTSPAPHTPLHRMIALADGAALDAGRIPSTSSRRGALCLRVHLPGSPDPPCSAHLGLELAVGCMPRSLIIAGLIPAGGHSVVLRTDRGAYRAHERPVPTSLAGSGRLALVAIPKTAVARSLQLTTASGRPISTKLGTPAAARQCGYRWGVTVTAAR